MLRAVSQLHPGLLHTQSTDKIQNLHELIVLKTQTLNKRRKQRQNKAVSAPKTQLISQTLGDWKSAPKAARNTWDLYYTSIAKLLGGESSSDEVSAASFAIWNVLNTPISQAALQKALATPGLAPLYIKTSLDPVWQEITSSLGSSAVIKDHGNLMETIKAYQGLKAWQEELAVGVGTQQQQQALVSSSKAATASYKPTSSPVPIPSSQEEVILAMCSCPPDIGLPILNNTYRNDNNKGSTAAVAATIAAGLADPGRQPLVVSEQQAAAVETQVFGIKGKVSNTEIGARWLLQWFYKTTDASASAGGSSGSASSQNDDTLPSVICSMLLSSKSNNEVASELFDLLGPAFFEYSGELLESRASLSSNIRKLIGELRQGDITSTAGTAGGGGSKGGATYGTAVTVTSKSAKIIEKVERKAERRNKLKAAAARVGSGDNSNTCVGVDADIDWLGMHGLTPLIEEELEKEADAHRIRLADGTEIRLGTAEGRIAGLPKGTSRKSYKGYEEVSVPAVQPSLPPSTEKRVLISDLPSWAQKAFQGYESLNRIQSRIFPTAFESNENVLVCAPTGAGKTNIAMIAVLREIGQNMDPCTGRINKADFKIIYVAPMKALAGEMTASFSKRLAPLGLTVKELTGDMQLSKKEMTETQMIVTTPEKWDVITRKGGEVGVAANVRLLIIDEVHLLNDERGPVIETLVARTNRLVESTQSMIRILGLSATLPNPGDVASFLGVSKTGGLFHFDASFRPVPLETQFVGVSEKNIFAQKGIMDDVCYQKVADSLRAGHQAMVFVHSRKDTGKTARMLALKAQQNSELSLFDASADNPQYGLAAKEARKSRNREITELFESGIGIHHAGMLRSDRNLMEKLFSDGILKVLCCTATLAWGVNLPAHTVIIKGTQLYNPQKGGFTDLGMLDVQQIFGRAGRPQFQDSGHGVIITTHDKLSKYLGMLTHQVPIESQFIAGLVDHLNAEIVLGTVTNIREAVQWMGYTYLFVRMKQNPLTYGISWEEVSMDSGLDGVRRKLIATAAHELERCKMARYDEKSGNLYVTELGRVASHFYINHSTITTYNELLKPHMSEADVLSLISKSSEFENLAVRDEEMQELDTLAREACYFDPKGGSENKYGKANILLQAYISRARFDSFSLIADLNYVSQNAPRLARALFEICARRGWSSAADLCLTIAKCLERRLWPEHFQHPLWQFEGHLKPELLRKLDDRGLTMERLIDMEANEIGAAVRHPAAGSTIASAVASFPSLSLEARVHPVTRSVVRVQLAITPTFKWLDAVHGGGLRWFIWVEDSENEKMYHSEMWTLTKKMCKEGTQQLAFTIPISEPLPSQYYIRVVSDSWLSAETLYAVSFKGLILPERHPPHTELMDLQPLPKGALGDPVIESMYKFSHFNPIQTQAFHTLYHTDCNVLLGAPTGSGKTISAELAMLRLFKAYPRQKVVYIAPLKALVKERMSDWGTGFCRTMNKKLVELTGDKTPDMRALLAADVIICTPEKWDGISRAWKSRTYVRKVGLLVIDEIHLLGADRGPILEVIVSRMRYVAAQTAKGIRFVGLSTALANAPDLADWLGVPSKGLFNFKPSVRPVPLECHIQGYPGKFYCPRMATMNKPSYAAIQTHSPSKPVLVFVSSRRQTRLTALDLIAHAAADDKPRAFLKATDEEIEPLLDTVRDASLRHTLQFGVGLHHAGLDEQDRKLVERLYVNGAIQILVATSTLAWGVNTPAHLVIIKGTEFYDAPTKRYVDYPITDVLQMMGRAGRPQYDHHGVAVIMVYEPKKSFYKKFLYEPFPVESSLQNQLADHLNAEIVGGTIASTQDAIDYLTWTFFIRRLLQNPSYYDLEGTDEKTVSEYLSRLVEDTLLELVESGCLEVVDDVGDGDGNDNDDGEGQGIIVPLAAGHISSMYYLKHETIRSFTTSLSPTMSYADVLITLCSASEYSELPVRHNEDLLNAKLATQVRWGCQDLVKTADDPHTKANLLLQSHMGQLPLPMADYITDTRSVLDNTLRILQAMVDLLADKGWLNSALTVMKLVQALMQGRWPDDNPLLQLPGGVVVSGSEDGGVGGGGKGVTLMELVRESKKNRDGVMKKVTQLFKMGGNARMAERAVAVCERMPDIKIEAKCMPAKASTKDSTTDDKDDQGEGSIKPILLGVTLKRAPSKNIIIGGRGLKPSSSYNAAAPRVYAPNFPKVKEEGWWLVVGDKDRGELYGIKRVSFGSETVTKICVNSIDGLGGKLSRIDVMLVSDAYLGVDIETRLDLI